VFDLTILSNTGPCYSRICRTEVFCPCSLERHFQAPVQVDRSSSSHDSRWSSIGAVHPTFILPSAVVSLLPLNQLPSSSALPCPFDSDASFQSVGWHRCDRNDEVEHWGCSCRHLVGLEKSDGVYNNISAPASGIGLRKDDCESLPLLPNPCRGPASE
jgi:hypothetical protein